MFFVFSCVVPEDVPNYSGIAHVNNVDILQCDMFLRYFMNFPYSDMMKILRSLFSDMTVVASDR